jgi:mannosyltransferase OCH1-like enzyme
MLPQHAHFVYGLWSSDHGLPLLYRDTLRAWQAQGWSTRLWRRRDCEALLKRHPEHRALFESMPRPVQRADLIRYLIVLHEGGFYFDLDCRPGKTRIPMLALSSEAVFFVEHVLPKKWPAEAAARHPIRRGRPAHREQIANFAFGAQPDHPVVRDVVALVAERCRENPSPAGDYDVLYTTGPDVTTEVVQSVRARYDERRLIILDHHPYMQHLCSGTWLEGRDHA